MSTSSEALPDSVSASKERVAASKRKNPPPESIENIQTRSQVVLSFWAIVIFLGLPIWWWTTSIHRARLPLRDMLEWADGKVFPLSISLHDTILNGPLPFRLANLRSLFRLLSMLPPYKKMRQSILFESLSMPLMILMNSLLITCVFV